jgi:hypothetical protein
MQSVFNLLFISMDRVVLELSVLSVIMCLSCKRTVYKVPSESETNSILILHVTVYNKNSNLLHYVFNKFYVIFFYAASEVFTSSPVGSEFF